MNENKPKSVFLSNLTTQNSNKTETSNNTQNTEIPKLKTAKDVIGKRPTKRFSNPFLTKKASPVAEELNGISLSGQVSQEKINQMRMQQQMQNSQSKNNGEQAKNQNKNAQKNHQNKNHQNNKNSNQNSAKNVVENNNNVVSGEQRRTTYSTELNSQKKHRQNNQPRKLNLFERIDKEIERQNEKESIISLTTEDDLKKANFKNKVKNSLKVMFLGGVCEIGKNMMALEYGRDIIIIDCGSIFPYSDLMPGIDLVVPEISYLTQNKDRIRGIVITHGHEDHIGAMPYVLNELEVPVYGSKLTMALVHNKLAEFPKIKAKLNTVKARDVIRLGCFSVEFINVNHSIAGSMALAITTPAGLMVHTGDFKIDFHSINKETTDLARFAELGSQGVMLLTCESTNVEREGYSMSESQVGKKLDELFERFKDDRIIVATFASNVHRLQQLLSLAEKYNRRVTFTGRSMQNVTETAYKIGELKFNPKIFIDLDDVNKYQDKEVLVISTGSQGEPMSALTRMASGEFQKIKLTEHDAVIISAAPIPGNEKSINNVINALYKLGCSVIYNSLEAVHASGHAHQEEIKLIHSLVKPKYFIPVHGEFRHLKLHKDLAVKMGTEARNVILPEIGNVIEVNSRSIKVVGNIPSGERLVDGLGLGDSDSSVLRDRKQLSEDGLAVAVLGLNTKTGEITSGPDIITRGLVYASEMETIIKEAKQVIKEGLGNIDLSEVDVNQIKATVRKLLISFFFKKTKRRPMVLAVILEN